MNTDDNKNQHLHALRVRYGELMSIIELMEVLKYNSEDAIRKAHKRGTLPVRLYRFQSKSGFFAKTIEVAQCIDNLKESES